MQITSIEFRTIEPVTSILRRDLVGPAMPDIIDGWIAPPTAPRPGLELNLDLVHRSRSRLDRQVTRDRPGLARRFPRELPPGPAHNRLLARSDTEAELSAHDLRSILCRIAS